MTWQPPAPDSSATCSLGQAAEHLTGYVVDLLGVNPDGYSELGAPKWLLHLSESHLIAAVGSMTTLPRVVGRTT